MLSNFFNFNQPLCRLYFMAFPTLQFLKVGYVICLLLTLVWDWILNPQNRNSFLVELQTWICGVVLVRASLRTLGIGLEGWSRSWGCCRRRSCRTRWSTPAGAAGWAGCPRSIVAGLRTEMINYNSGTR